MNGKPLVEPRSILIAQTAFLGDVVLTTPLFKAARRLWPGANITLLTTPQAAPLVEEDPHLSAVLTYDKKGGESLFSAARRLKKGGFDLMIAPHRSHRTALLGFLAGIPVRAGYAEAGFSFLYTHKVARPMALHEVDRILALLPALGAKILPSDRELFCGCTDAERAKVSAVLAAAGIEAGERVVGMSPGSVWATKRWGTEGFAELARLFTSRGRKVALIGGPDDRAVTAKVAALAGSGVYDFAGLTPLKCLPAWMERFTLFVTNDSAPLHVAAAKDVPTVAIFGPTVKSLGFFPFHAKSRVVEAKLACRPCGLHGHDACPKGHHRCMLNVSAEAVFKTCRELEGENGG